jgi:hypothetical protein
MTTVEMKRHDTTQPLPLPQPTPDHNIMLQRAIKRQNMHWEQQGPNGSPCSKRTPKTLLFGRNHYIRL